MAAVEAAQLTAAAPATAATAAEPAESQPRPATAAAEGAAAAAPPGVTANGSSTSARPDAEAEFGASTEEVAPAEDNGAEVSYLPAVEPEKAFGAARAAAQQLHECLERLRRAKAAEGAGGAEALAATAQNMQLQLLALRRAHRAMAKAADGGRSVELSKLRPLLEGADEADEDEDADEAGEEAGKGGAAGKGLATRLEAERAKRASLFAKLETLEAQKAKDMEAFRDVAKVTDSLATRLRAVEHALEPVCDLLELRPRPTGAAPAVEAGSLARLPAPLRLLLLKFDALAAFGPAGGVSVRLEGAASDSQEPPEKRAKVEGSGASESPPVVCVEVTAGAANATLRFSSPQASLVAVAVEGGEGLLEALWPEDDGRHAGLMAMLPSGTTAVAGHSRPYGWAQLLAGLRESVQLVAPALQHAEGVTAADVVQRVKLRLCERSKS